MFPGRSGLLEPRTRWPSKGQVSHQHLVTGMQQSWIPALHPQIKVDAMYGEHLMHRADPAPWPVEVPRSSLPPHLVSGGSMCSAGSVADLQAMHDGTAIKMHALD